VTNVPPALIYHDLITRASGRSNDGIYWLRIYAEGTKRVAVVTEVPGNPGQNVMNASERIVDEIERRLSPDSPMGWVYIVMPRGSAEPDRCLTWRVEVAPELRWLDASIAEIEDVVGQRLAPLPPHDDLLWRVVTAGGDLEDQIEEPIYQAIPVDALPPPHAPWKCAHAARFEAMKAALGEAHVSDQELAAIGEKFIASLTADDIASCRYHAADWRSIAEESVRTLERSASTDREDLVAQARSSTLPPTELRWLVSLFQDPVVAHDLTYGNGQHRGCALRFSGATHAVVVRGFRTCRVDPGVWVYQGDG
jgi:hypothetical protein